MDMCEIAVFVVPHGYALFVFRSAALRALFHSERREESLFS
jgi:hypothetical protein